MTIGTPGAEPQISRLVPHKILFARRHRHRQRSADDDRLRGGRSSRRN